MDVNEVLQFVDRLVFEHTGKHLDNLQKSIVEGAWQRHTYDDIAQECHVNKNYASDVGADLWQTLSEVLGEEIKKNNFRSTLERVYIESSQNICIGTNHNFNFHSKSLDYSNKNSIDHSQKLPHHYLKLAPQIINFYNRESELKTLSYWILEKNYRLITVLGISGIGKTTLVKKFVDLKLEQFPVIIWQSLQFPKPLELLIDDLFNICEIENTGTLDDKLKKIFDILTEKKCLIILDDVHNIFTSGQLAGQYQTEYQNYQNFFRMIFELEHQSSMILISREQSGEMECLDDVIYPMKSLPLSGLKDVQILEKFALKHENNLLELVKLYEGNPTYLKGIAILIKDIFASDVNQFLAEKSLIITNSMQFRLQQVLYRLSPIEKSLVLHLSKFDQAINREALRKSIDLSSIDFINGLQSLQRRYLLITTKTDQMFFQLSPVFHEYIKILRTG